MSNTRRVRKAMDGICESVPLAATALAEQELDRVVGGYIGETEKNIRPAIGKQASVC